VQPVSQQRVLLSAARSSLAQQKARHPERSLLQLHRMRRSRMDPETASAPMPSAPFCPSARIGSLFLSKGQPPRFPSFLSLAKNSSSRAQPVLLSRNKKLVILSEVSCSFIARDGVEWTPRPLPAPMPSAPFCPSARIGSSFSRKGSSHRAATLAPSTQHPAPSTGPDPIPALSTPIAAPKTENPQ
jgi:hypothetical protein